MSTRTANDLDTVADYQFERATFEKARDEYRVAKTRYLELRGALTEVRHDMDAIEVEIVCNGGWGPCTQCQRIGAGGGLENHLIDGKNAEQRKAQLDYALLHHEQYQAAQRTRIDMESDLGLAEGDMDIAEQTMRGARLGIEFLSSWNLRSAAAEGGLGFERKYGNGSH